MGFLHFLALSFSILVIMFSYAYDLWLPFKQSRRQGGLLALSLAHPESGKEGRGSCLLACMSDWAGKGLSAFISPGGENL
jgi:hypothetical protein